MAAAQGKEQPAQAQVTTPPRKGTTRAKPVDPATIHPHHEERGPGKRLARLPGVIDWHAIEREYRTGKLSNIELGRKHCVHPTTLSKRIRRDQERNPASWQRDLTAQVRQATAALLIQQQTQATLMAGQEAAAILAAATATRDVILGHRGDVRAARELMGDLMGELKAATTRPDALARLLAQAGADLDAAQRKALAADLQNLLQLHQRVGSMQRLADTLAKLHTSERKAFGITDDEGGSDPVDAMSEADLEREIASLEAQRGGGLKLVG